MTDSEPLRAAGEHVERSDRASRSVMGSYAKSGETRALRDAVRALLQEVRALRAMEEARRDGGA